MKTDTPGKRLVVMLAGGGTTATSGGVGTLLVSLIDAWAGQADAWPVRVIDTRGGGGLVGGATAFLRALGLLLALGLRGRVAIVHAHMTTRGSVVRKCILCALARLLRLPTIVHQHGADFHHFYPRQPPPFRWLIRTTLNRADSVIVPGERWADFLTRDVGVAPGKIAVIPNGVPPASTMAKNLDPALPHILFLGRLGDRKGVPELITALSHPRMRGRTWRATIAGDGDVDRFRRTIGQAGLAGRVGIPGWQDRSATGALLRTADMLVLPSHHEAMPVAVLEALAHRVAVVTTPVGAVPEFLHDGTTALLIPPGDPWAIVDAMVRLLDDAEERARIAGAGYRVVVETLDIAVVATRLLRQYEATLARHDRHAGRMMAGSILGRIELIQNAREHAALLRRLAAPATPTVVSFVNHHAINMAWSRRVLGPASHAADVLLRDGVGIELCLLALGRNPGMNMNGTDFIPLLAKTYSGRRVALFGTVEPWTGQAADALRGLGCTVVSALDGFRPIADYLAELDRRRPELVILAMGTPQQERVAQALSAAATGPMLIVNGGAIADFMGGRFVRAPALMRRLRLEWAFRLALEPRRLFSRYVIGGSVFLWRCAQLRRTTHG